MRRVNPRLAKINRSYSVSELAELLGVHKHTVRGWVRAGLPTVDKAKPTLIHGDEFQAWWAKRTKAKKCPLKSGEFYCFKCREPKRAALGMVEYASMTPTSGNLKALCETCQTLMHRRVRVDAIPTEMPGLDVKIEEAPSSIGVQSSPSQNTDKQMES